MMLQAATKRILIMLFLSATVFGAPAKAANFCTQALTAASYESNPDRSTLIITTTVGTERIDDTDLRFDHFLEQYLVKNPLRTELNDEKVVYKSSLVDGKLRSTVKMTKGMSFYFDKDSRYGFHITKADRFGKVIVTFDHYPTLNKIWKPFLKLKLVGVLEDETEPYLYMKYLRNGRLPISLGSNFHHDIFDHALGYQYLAAHPVWNEFIATFDKFDVFVQKMDKTNEHQVSIYETLSAILMECMEDSSFNNNYLLTQKKEINTSSLKTCLANFREGFNTAMNEN